MNPRAISNCHSWASLLGPGANPLEWRTLRTRALLTLSLVVFVEVAGATGQIPDQLQTAEGSQLLLSNPLETYLEVRPELAKLVRRSHCTATWRGYSAAWKIEESMLYLVQIRANPCDERNPQYVSLNTIFPEAQESQLAYWYTGTLVVPTGKLVKYVHMGYESRYESYAIFSVKDGLVFKQEKAKAADGGGFEPASTERSFERQPRILIRDAITRSRAIRRNASSVVALDEDGHDGIAVNLMLGQLTIYQTKSSELNYLAAVYLDELRSAKLPDGGQETLARLTMYAGGQEIEFRSSEFFEEKRGDQTFLGIVIELQDWISTEKIWCGLRDSKRKPYPIKLSGPKHWAGYNATEPIQVPESALASCPRG